MTTSGTRTPVYDFRGRTALVTGAGSGMGRAVALAFAQAGANLVLADRDEAQGEAVAAAIEAEGGNALAVRTDISQGADVDALLAAAIDQFGTVDMACNAAGIDIERTEFVDCADEVFDKVIDVNLRGSFLCMRGQIRQMLAQGAGGAIVNLASVAAIRARSDTSVAYSASKAGLIALGRNAAMRYARDGIRVNTICPGAIRTPMLEASMIAMGVEADQLGAGYGAIGRIGSPEEVADAVLWLCSPASAFIVGHVLPVDGGYLAR